MRPSPIAVTATLALTLAACAPAVEVDAGAEVCKAAAARSMGVDVAQTSAVAAGTDLTGVSTYNVFAGGTGFRCTVAEDGAVSGMTQL